MVQCVSHIPENNTPDDNEDNTPSVHPVFDIMKQYTSVDAPEIDIIPYTVNLMAIDLLKKNSKVTQVKAYIDWYLSHLNYPDKYGATGSIYDYKIFADGNEKSLETFDSVDSYAATFIMLIDRYFTITGNRSFIELNRKKLEDIIYLVPFLRDTDGLTFAIPGIPHKYLMDNCEAYGGVVSFVNLAGKMNWDILPFYQALRSDFYNSIRQQFPDPDNIMYFWSIETDYKTASSWSNFYPDSYAQLFPILYGLEPDSAQRKRLWEIFNRRHEEQLEQLPVEQKIVYDWTQEIMDSLNSESENVEYVNSEGEK